MYFGHEDWTYQLDPPKARFGRWKGCIFARTLSLEIKPTSFNCMNRAARLTTPIRFRSFESLQHPAIIKLWNKLTNNNNNNEVLEYCTVWMFLNSHFLFVGPCGSPLFLVEWGSFLGLMWRYDLDISATLMMRQLMKCPWCCLRLCSSLWKPVNTITRWWNAPVTWWRRQRHWAS